MAKKLIAYSLLMFYLAFQLRPLTVVISDALAHTFFRVQHMATIHYENGKYHVHHDLKAISDSENGLAKTNTPASKKAGETVSSHVFQSFEFQFNRFFSGSSFIKSSHAGILPAFTRLDVPPPKA